MNTLALIHPAVFLQPPPCRSVFNINDRHRRNRSEACPSSSCQKEFSLVLRHDAVKRIRSSPKWSPISPRPCGNHEQNPSDYPRDRARGLVEQLVFANVQRACRRVGVCTVILIGGGRLALRALPGRHEAGARSYQLSPSHPPLRRRDTRPVTPFSSNLCLS